MAGRGEPGVLDALRSLLQSREALDRFALDSLDRFEFFGGLLGPEQFFFFPSVGIAALPLFGLSSAPVVVFLPTGPKTFFGAVSLTLPKDIAEEQVRAAMANGTLSACSVGLKCKRVIVPDPMFLAAGETNMKSAIHTFRSRVDEIEALTHQMNALTGL